MERPVGVIPYMVSEQRPYLPLSVVALNSMGEVVGFSALTVAEVPEPLIEANEVLDDVQLIYEYSAFEGLTVALSDWL